MSAHNRRRFHAAAAASALNLAACAGPSRFAGRSAVAVLKAASYDADLTAIVLRGIELAGLRGVRGKRVLLKPNLVEFDSATAINTHPRVVRSVFEAFQSLGAEVTVAEGPGHRRDTLGLAEEAGYWKYFAAFEDRFVDLNRDDVRNGGPLMDRPEFYFSETLLAADLIVSLPKLKTHHWAGATLSMKNFFGLVPGGVYGWPKNLLHHYGIPRSIVALNRRFRNTFAIVDGITGMEGNGPIQGTPRPLGALVFGRDLVSVDATCCRMMGIDPEKVQYLADAADLGALAEAQIDQRGEQPRALRQNFDLTHRFEHLRL